MCQPIKNGEPHGDIVIIKIFPFTSCSSTEYSLYYSEFTANAKLCEHPHPGFALMKDFGVSSEVFVANTFTFKQYAFIAIEYI